MADPQLPEDTFVLDKERIEEGNRAFERGGVVAYEDYLRKTADESKNISLNIGLIGNSGTGKSTFINTIRGLTGDDDGAAIVGETETIAKVRSFPHPNNPRLKFWDLPGVGTPTFPKEKYLVDIEFDKFDFFLIMCKDRFTENDQWIAKEIAEKKKQFFFIRSKIHDSICNDKRSHPRTHDEVGLLAKIKKDIEVNLGGVYRENGVFLIDNHERQLYDFNLLEQRLIDELPSLKQAAFILSMNTMSEEMVKRKVALFRGDTLRIAAMSALSAVNPSPIPGVSFLADVAMMLRKSNMYFKQLGLNDESLKRIAEIMACNPSLLQEIVTPIQIAYVTVQGMVSLLQQTSSMVMDEASNESEYLAGVLAKLLAGCISGRATYVVLNSILTTLEETALKVIKAAVANSTSKMGKSDGQ